MKEKRFLETTHLPTHCETEKTLYYTFTWCLIKQTWGRVCVKLRIAVTGILHLTSAEQ